MMPKTVSCPAKALLVAALTACQPGAGATPTKAESPPASRPAAATTSGEVGSAPDPALAAVTLRKEFESQFRRAVLAKDVNWIITKMDPLGWQLGDAELSADIYASEFRAGRLDYEHVFGEQRSYREWFTRCPEPWATESWDSPLGRPGEAYGIRWFSQNCQADTPTIRIRQQGSKVYITNLTD